MSSIARLEQLLVKMRLWESALVNHFRGRTYPVNHPMWAKLKSVRLLLKLESSKVRFDVVHMCIYYLCSSIAQNHLLVEPWYCHGDRSKITLLLWPGSTTTTVVTVKNQV